MHRTDLKGVKISSSVLKMQKLCGIGSRCMARDINFFSVTAVELKDHPKNPA